MREWLRGLGKPSWGDAVAGASVGLVLLPQSMAYAELAGLPPAVGLSAAALPPIVAAFFVSSRHLETGPTAIMALLTFGVLEGTADRASAGYVQQAALLALIVGAARVVLGLLRLGTIAYLMSEPVLLGFTSGSAVLIMASQIPTIFDTSPDGGGVLARAWDTLTDPGDWQSGALALAGATLALMLLGPSIHRLFPGVLIAVVAGTVFSALGGYDGSTIGYLPGGFVDLSLDLPWSEAGALIVPGVVIAVVGFAEPASIARTFASADRQRWNASRDLVSQGVANLASSVSGGFPVGGSFGRSALGRMAGGTSRWSGALAGLLLLVFMPFSPVFEDLPKAILGAIVFGAGSRLIQARSMLRLWSESRPQALLAWVTFGATLALAPRVDRSVMIGIVLAILIHAWRETKLEIDTEYDGGTLTLRPSGVIWFVSAPALEDRLLDLLADHPDSHHLVIDLAATGRIDYTGASALARVVDDARRAGLESEVVGIPGHSQRTLGALLPTPRLDD